MQEGLSLLKHHYSQSSAVFLYLERQLCLEPSVQPHTATQAGVWSIQLLLATRASVWRGLSVTAKPFSQPTHAGQSWQLRCLYKIPFD